MLLHTRVFLNRKLFARKDFTLVFLVEMKTEEIEEVCLDQILVDIHRLDQNKCLSIGKEEIFISF